MPIYMNYGKIDVGGGLRPESFSVPIVSVSEVQGFSQDPPFTQEQVDRATASLTKFVEQLPEDEQLVITHVLQQAALAGEATT